MLVAVTKCRSESRERVKESRSKVKQPGKVAAKAEKREKWSEGRGERGRGWKKKAREMSVQGRGRS